jgi:hypothetical protein
MVGLFGRSARAGGRIWCGPRLPHAAPRGSHRDWLAGWRAKIPGESLSNVNQKVRSPQSTVRGIGSRWRRLAFAKVRRECPRKRRTRAARGTRGRGPTGHRANLHSPGQQRNIISNKLRIGDQVKLVDPREKHGGHVRGPLRFSRGDRLSGPARTAGRGWKELE